MMLSLNVKQSVNLKRLAKFNKIPTACFQMITGALEITEITKYYVHMWLTGVKD